MTREEKLALRQELCAALLACDETKAADCIRRGADINAPDADGYTPIYDAIDAGNVDAVKLIAKLGGDLCHEHVGSDPKYNYDNETPALYACNEYQFNCLMCLLDLGVSPNDANSTGWSILMQVCVNSPFENWVEPLLQRGADVKAKTKDGMTAFGVAAIDTIYCAWEIIPMLLDAGADIDEQDENGETAVMAYAYGEGESPDYIEYFLERGANPNLRNKEGKTALDIAQEHNNAFAVEKLRQFGGKQGKDLPV